MSPSAQRQAIGQALGYQSWRVKWSWTALPEIVECAPEDSTFITLNGETWDIDGAYPDYLNDLNAMHEAEGFLSPEQLPRYENQLRIMCLSTGCTCVWYATAAQRAEAFLWTVGKWEKTS